MSKLAQRRIKNVVYKPLIEFDAVELLQWMDWVSWYRRDRRAHRNEVMPWRRLHNNPKRRGSIAKLYNERIKVKEQVRSTREEEGLLWSPVRLTAKPRHQYQAQRTRCSVSGCYSRIGTEEVMPGVVLCLHHRQEAAKKFLQEVVDEKPSFDSPPYGRIQIPGR